MKYQALYNSGGYESGIYTSNSKREAETTIRLLAKKYHRPGTYSSWQVMKMDGTTISAGWINSSGRFERATVEEIEDYYRTENIDYGLTDAERNQFWNLMF